MRIIIIWALCRKCFWNVFSQTNAFAHNKSIKSSTSASASVSWAWRELQACFSRNEISCENLVAVSARAFTEEETSIMKEKKRIIINYRPDCKKLQLNVLLQGSEFTPRSDFVGRWYFTRIVDDFWSFLSYRCSVEVFFFFGNNPDWSWSRVPIPVKWPSPANLSPFMHMMLILLGKKVTVLVFPYPPFNQSTEGFFYVNH